MPGNMKTYFKKFVKDAKAKKSAAYKLKQRKQPADL